jgi:phage gp36-like protein
MLTLDVFLQRVDETTLAQLTDEQSTRVDELKCTRALAAAWGELQGYVFDIPGDKVPPVETLDAHHFHLTMYHVAGNRSGTEFESYAKRYDASIKYLSALRDKYASTADSAGVNVGGEDVVPVFDTGSLDAMGSLGIDS